MPQEANAAKRATYRAVKRAVNRAANRGFGMKSGNLDRRCSKSGLWHEFGAISPRHCGESGVWHEL